MASLIGARAQSLLSLTIAGGSNSGGFTQNFDGLPSGGNFIDLSVTGSAILGTQSGIYTNQLALQPSTGAPNIIGAIPLAGQYSFGVAGTNPASDRALGSNFALLNVVAGILPIRYGVLIRNDAGRPIQSMNVSYTGEQWYNDNSGTPQTLSFDYVQVGTNFNLLTAASLLVGDVVGATFSTSLTSGQLNFTSPNITTRSFLQGPFELDGNAAGNRTALTGTITFSTPIPVGGYVLLRWSDPYDNGLVDHSLAIDDLAVTATLVPNQPPVANTIPNQNANVGTAFNYTIPAGTFTDPDGGALTVSLAGLPPGLTYTGSTSAITGTPTTTGPYTVTATVTDSEGSQASTQFTITVGPPIPPAIGILAPSNLSLCVGQPLSLTLTGLQAANALLAGITVAPGLTANIDQNIVTITGLTSGINIPINLGINLTILGIPLTVNEAVTVTVLDSQPPTVTPGTITTTQGASNVLFSASCPSGTVTYTASNGTSGGSGTATGTIPVSTASTGTVSYSVVCQLGACVSAPTVVTSTVNPAPNQPPFVANPIPPQSGTVGTPFTYTIPANTFQDPEGGPVSVSVSNLPPGLTSNGGTITGTPTTAGTYTATVTGTDAGGATVTTPLVITVSPAANQAPFVANPIPPQSGTVGTPFTYTIPANTFQDPEGGPVTVSVTNLPPGLTSNGGTITGTPTAAGTFTATVTGTDASGASVSTPLVITVNPTNPGPGNQAPLVANPIPPQSGTVGTPFTYNVPGNTFSDPNGDPLTVSVTNLPPGLNASGGSITGTPTQVGTFTATVSAQDPSGASVSTPLVITVNPANQAPFVANPIPPQSGTVGTPFTYNIPANTFQDPEGGPVTVSVTNLPPGLSSTGGNITGTPTQAGTFTATVTGADPSGATVSTPLVITVNPATPGNQPPFVANPIPPQSGTVGTPFTYIIPSNTFQDPEGGTVTVSISNLPPGLNSVGNTISGTPTQAGTFTATVTGTDPNGATVSTPLVITVSPNTPANQPPFVANPIPPQSGTVGTPFTYTIPANTFQDPEGGPVSVSVSNLPPGLTSNGGTITGTPTTPGTYTATVTGTDPSGASVSTPLVITVNPSANGNFGITGATVSCTFVTTGQYRVSIQPQYSGLNGQPVSFSIVNLLSATTQAGPYVLTLYTDNPNITLSATQSGVNSTYTFNFVTACGNTPGGNQAPIVANPIPPQSGTVGVPFTYNIPAGTFSDPNGDPLTVSITNLPPGLGSNGGNITGTPTTAGTYTATVTATDPSGASVSTPLVITVNPAAPGNQAPIVANPIPPQSGTVGTPFTYTIPANTFTDPNGDPLTVSVTNLPPGLGSNGGNITGTPTTAGTFTATVTARDPSGASVSTPLVITISPAGNNPGNQAPIVANPIPPQSGTVGVPFTYNIPAGTFNDPNGDPLTVSITNLPPGLGSNGGNITGTPTIAGTYTATVTARDPSGASVSTPLVITVNPAANTGNFAITGVTVNCTLVTTGQYRVSITPQYSGLNGQPVSFSIVNLLLPTTQAAPYILTLYSDNPNITLSATQSGVNSTYTFNFVTACGNTPGGNQAPIVANPIPPQSGTVGVPFTYNIPAGTFSDPNGDPLTVSITNLPPGLGSNGGNITGTPTTAGTYTATVTARDPSGASVSTPLVITVNPANNNPGNQAPIVANPIPPQSGTVGTPFTFTVPPGTFVDPNGDPLTVSITNLPPGLGSNGGTVTGTPTTPGTFTATVTATDPGGASVSTPVVITISPAGNTNPGNFAITGVTVSCTVISSGQRRVSITPQYSGLNGQPVSFSIVNILLPTTQAAPYVLALYTDNPTITLSATQSGVTSTYTFNFVAACGNTNPGGNQAPIVANTIPPQSGTVGTPFTYTIPSGTFTDPNGDPLTVSITNLPPGLGSNGGTITGTPTTAGTYTGTVTATDPSGASVSTPIVITINPANNNPGNQAPIVANPIPPQSGTVGVPFTYNIPNGTFTDPNGDPLTVSITNLPPGLGSNGGNITGTPTTPGTFVATVTATDPGGQSVSTPLTITINPANNTGNFAIIGATVSCTTLSPTLRRVSITPQYSGLNGQQITFRIVNELVATTNPAPYILTIYTDNPTIQLRATQAGTSGEASFTLNWLSMCGGGNNPGGNQAPIVANPIPPQSGTVGTPFTFTVPPGTFSDPNGDPLTVNITNLPPGLGSNGGNITGTPTTPGTYVVTVTATDPSGASVSTPLTITINPANNNPGGNQAPVVANPIPPQSGTVGTPFTFTVPPGTFSDPNGDPLTVSITNLPPGLSSNGGTVTGTPTTPGSYTLIVTAQDPSGASVSTPLVVTISPSGNTGGNGNCGTNLDGTPLRATMPIYDCAVVKTSGNIRFTGAGGNPNGGPVEFMAIGITGWTTNCDAIIDLETRTKCDAPPIEIEIRQRVNGEWVYGQSFIFRIRQACPVDGCPPIQPTNRPPVVNAGIPNQVATVGQTYDYDVPSNAFSDPDGDFLLYTVNPLPESFTTSSGHFHATPTVAATYSITVTAYDNAGGSAFTTFTFTVRPASNARVGLPETIERPLNVRVLGNPTANESIEVEVEGVEGRPLGLRIVDTQGTTVSEQTIEKAGATERQTMRLGRGAGMYLLNVTTPGQVKTVKIIKQ
jgi:hypothetical protein